MLQVRNVTLETTLDAPFTAPVPFDSANLKGVAVRALEKFGKYELRHNQFALRLGDQLFDYALAFTLFNGQATVRLTTDRLFARIQGAKNQKDLDIVAEALLGSVQCIDSTIGEFTLASAAHASFEIEPEGVTYLQSFVDQSNYIIEGGRITLVKHPDWELPVRITVEKSVFVNNGVFLTWNTEQKGSVSLENLKIIADKFGKAANSVGLSYRIE
jgi:hypothetical protein